VTKEKVEGNLLPTERHGHTQKQQGPGIMALAHPMEVSLYSL
jgi:hypothetical protein